MIRKALIIANNTGKDASTYLEGVNKDIINYNAYLKSEIGGDWYNSEIRTIQNGTKEEIASAILACSGDYSFVVFTGHGFINSRDGLTYICVKDAYMCETELNTYLTRRSLILDCCREVTSLTENFSGRGPTAMLSRGGQIGGISKNVMNARAKFDSGLTMTQAGQFTGYACLRNQLSGDNPAAGGVFSTTLMRVGVDFGSQIRSYYSMPIKEAVLETKRILDNDPLTDQSPDWKVTTGLNVSAPFAVANWRNPNTGLLW